MTSQRRTGSPPGAESKRFGAGGKMFAGVGAGIAAGLVSALGDGLAILLENPRSFASLASGMRFLATAGLLQGMAGALGGLLLAGVLRLRPSRVFGCGVGFAIFAALGVRAHVRFLFGEPLLAPASLAANAGIALVAILGGVLATRIGRRLDEGGLVPFAALSAATAISLAFLASDRVAREPARAPADPGAPDLLLVTLDTTRADHLSGYGYPRGTTPAIDRLARRGTTFPVAHVPVPLTNPSHCSLFTGLEPDEHGVRNNGTALPDTIPTFVRDLAAAGYACGAFVSGIPLKHGLSGLAPGFIHYDDVFSPLERAHPMTTSLAVVRVANRVLPGDLIERRARDTCRAAIAWLEETSGPRFLWVHLFDPHSPYDAPAWRRDRYARDAAMTAEGRAANDWPIADYDAELRETDRWLDVLLRTFERETAGRGVVWLTADHGEGLEQHGELTHGTQLFEEDLRVPLITSRRDAREGAGEIARGSVFSTALPELMRETDWVGVFGTDVVRANTYPPEGRGRLTAVIGRLADGRWGKLWIDRVHGEERGYDLDSDPSERRPVTPDATFEPLRAFAGDGEPEAGHELDPETERRLRSLGYTH